MRQYVIAFAFLGILSPAWAQLADTPWPTLNRDLQRTGRTPVVGPQSPTLKWRFRTGASCFSGIAIGSDGTVYFGSNDHFVYALNPDGTEKWRFETGERVWSAGPTIGANGTIYIGGVDNYLHALNADGTEKWRFRAGEEFAHIYGAPAIDEHGVIYFGARPEFLFALSPVGQELWRFPGMYFAGSPAIGHDGRIYAPTETGNDHLYCLNRDGQAVWSAPDNEAYSGCTIGDDGVLYVHTWINEETLRATNPDGTFRWEVNVGSAIGQPCIGWNGTIYSSGDGLHAVSPNGEVLWITGPPSSSYPVVDGLGTVYVGSDDPEVLAFNPDGTRKWRFTGVALGTSRTQFALDADGTLFFSDEGGWFYALRDPVVAAALTDFEVTHGQRIGGGLVALSKSDDAYIVLASHPFHRLSEPNRSVWALGGFTNVESPERMDVKIEVRLSLPGGVCKIAFRDFDTGRFESYGEFPTTTQDKTHWLTGVPTSRFVREDGRIEMELKTVIVEPITQSTFRSYFDEVRIEVRDYSEEP